MPDDDLLATDRALVARMKEVREHIEDMGDDERVFMLGALCGALERHLDAEHPQLPLAAQIRAWLVTHDWNLASSGPGGASGRPSGTLWQLAGSAEMGVIVPDGDGDTMATTGALKRIASRSHLPLDSLTREMRRLLHG
jgi:hypothetical protein